MSESKISTIESKLKDFSDLYYIKKDRKNENDAIHKKIQDSIKNFKKLIQSYSKPDNFLVLIITLADLTSKINTKIGTKADLTKALEIEEELKSAINKVLKPIDTTKLKEDIKKWLETKPFQNINDEKPELKLKSYANFIARYTYKHIKVTKDNIDSILTELGYTLPSLPCDIINKWSNELGHALKAEDISLFQKTNPTFSNNIIKVCINDYEYKLAVFKLKEFYEVKTDSQLLENAGLLQNQVEPTEEQLENESDASSASSESSASSTSAPSTENKSVLNPYNNQSMDSILYSFLDNMSG